ncbi:hypothetical protein [Vibrio gazogenes]|uniref:Uncharacterized protein n=1 Tax=Vibrio gazogenes TaxID=687 RepID=A0A1Z2SL81_VIBGA|nr:hypothetical protein [Vibrio gazogenes]ASA57895.1 hypothetical protein BSQ33_19475 [Vibrio gazogenes]
MSYINPLLSLLGLPKSDTTLSVELEKKDIVISNELVLGDDEYRAYIERPNYGFCLIFTDESYFLGNSGVAIGEGELFYSGVFFHSEGKDDYKEYKEDLPFNLSFLDTRDDVLNKLGRQSWQRLAKDGVRVISDRWDDLAEVPYRLSVTYDKESGRVSIISASIPDQPLNG